MLRGNLERARIPGGGSADGLHPREIPRRISQARLTVDLGALSGVPALRAKPKTRDTPLGMTALHRLGWG